MHRHARDTEHSNQCAKIEVTHSQTNSHQNTTNPTAKAPTPWMPLFSLRKRKANSTNNIGRACMITDTSNSGTQASATKMPIVAKPSPKLSSITLSYFKALLQTRSPFVSRITNKLVAKPLPNIIMTSPVGEDLVNSLGNRLAKVNIAILARSGKLYTVFYTILPLPSHKRNKHSQPEARVK